MHSITGSVGEGGMNHAVDTALIQTLLVMLPNDAGGAALAIDGDVGPSTKQAIRHFQQEQLLMEDGLVQPNDLR
jgi:peptidoglycan hydrolase-like protein with peptidoglycan-binding domain